MFRTVLVLSLVARAALADDAIPNAQLREAYLKRARAERRAGIALLAVGLPLLAGSMAVSTAALATHDARLGAASQPWLADAALFGLVFSLAAAGSNGDLFLQRAEALAPDGSTPRAALFAEERGYARALRRAGIAGLATGLSVTAISGGVLALALTSSGDARDTTLAWTGAVALVGVTTTALGAAALGLSRRKLALLDAGSLDDLEPAVVLAPQAVRGGGLLAIAGRF
jgi:hypothetical protein